jgi:hypothetical protein
VPVKNDMPIEEKVVGAGDDYETVGCHSEAAAILGSMFQPEDVASEEEEEIPGIPG